MTMRKTILAAGALCALLSTSFTAPAAHASATTAAAPTAAGPLARRHALEGRLALEPGVTAPTYLRVRLDDGRAITVNVGAGTAIVRRYDGASSLDQLAIGDLLQLKGSFEPGSNTFDASYIEDVSLQEAYTGARIELTSFAPATLAGRGIVRNDVRNAPYQEGAFLNMQFASAVTVIRRDGSAGSIADLSALRLHERIHVSGRYDRHSNLLIVLRVHL